MHDLYEQPRCTAMPSLHPASANEDLLPPLKPLMGVWVVLMGFVLAGFPLRFVYTSTASPFEHLPPDPLQARQHHPFAITFEGPYASETGDPNPFRDYRLNVTFRHDGTGETLIVPGYFAADGNAAETSARSGNIWKVHFAPDDIGTWNYEINFLKGKNAAIAENIDNLEKLTWHGTTGSFEVADSDKSGKDFRSKGRLMYTGERYLQFAETGEYFLKGGADSPENFLAYIDFDSTYYGGNRKHRSGESAPNLGLHAYEPHVQDWQEGDPTWQDGKGKGMIGALNYLASEDMNSVYFLTMNILGDGDDVWPYTDRNERYRFDCSKLDQWEIVFSHMDELGLMQHFVLQETENEVLLDGGYLDVQRKLYLRELVARFGHHLAVTWNLGEEHGPTDWAPYGQTTKDTKAMASYLTEINPYNEFVVMHTHSYKPKREEIVAPMLGFEDMEGPSIQVANPKNTHEQTLKWLQLSADSAHQWVVNLDEIGIAWKGAMPDADDPDHDTIRHHTLWGNLMAGGGGVEWYFGYRYAHNDLNAEDWRSRDLLWDQTRYALEFFHQHLPFWEMESADQLVDAGYCFAQPGEIYVVYKPIGESTGLNLTGVSGNFTVQWFNPKSGGDLQQGSVADISAGGKVNLGNPPSNPEGDWVILLNKQ